MTPYRLILRVLFTLNNGEIEFSSIKRRLLILKIIWLIILKK